MHRTNIEDKNLKLLHAKGIHADGGKIIIDRSWKLEKKIEKAIATLKKLGYNITYIGKIKEKCT